MSTLSQFTGGAKPKQVTTYTSGTGNYTPSAPNAWCYVTLVGGGGGGCGAGGGTPGGYGGYGGRAGAVLQRWVQLSGSTAYAVGAGGTGGGNGGGVGNNGGSTTLDSLSAVGGNRGGYCPPQGAWPNTGASGIVPGESSSFGSAGCNGISQSADNATGFGSGGGGSIQTWNGGSPGSGGTGGNGSGGLIIIEDFGP
jgi:hypothetical protein